jgi:hypothetical protein
MNNSGLVVNDGEGLSKTGRSRLIPERVKPQSHAVRQELVSEKVSFAIENWGETKSTENYQFQKDLVLCDRPWRFIFRSHSDYYESESASVYIENRSSDNVIASYSITLKNQLEVNPDIEFTDPDGLIRFEASGGADDRWGTDDFVESVMLSDEEYGYIGNDALQFEVEIRTQGNIQAREGTLMRAIEQGNESDDLIAIANEDIEPFKMKYTISQATLIKQQEDAIVRTLTNPLPVNSGKTRHQRTTSSPTSRQTSSKSGTSTSRKL